MQRRVCKGRGRLQTDTECYRAASEDLPSAHIPSIPYSDTSQSTCMQQGYQSGADSLQTMPPSLHVSHACHSVWGGMWLLQTVWQHLLMVAPPTTTSRELCLLRRYHPAPLLQRSRRGTGAPRPDLYSATHPHTADLGDFGLPLRDYPMQAADPACICGEPCRSSDTVPATLGRYCTAGPGGLAQAGCMRDSRAMTEASNFMRMVVLGRDCPSTSTECAVTLSRTAATRQASYINAWDEISPAACSQNRLS